MKTITQSEINELKKKNRVVVIYPRKKVVCVDGFQYFKLKEVRS